jgi:CoA:oxalate CoA-transferase
MNNTYIAQFASLTKVLGVERLAVDPLYVSNALRVANRPKLLEELASATCRQDTEYWVDALGKANVPCSPINPFSKVIKQ